MRHDLYVDSYRRYKRGTAKVAQWLANAGRLCGVKLDLGKKVHDKYLMPLNKFRELAGIIAQCKEPEIEVRPELFDLLQETISLRQAATVFFRSNSSTNEHFEQSNEGHLYTIEVLQEVLDTLEPLRKVQQPPDPKVRASGTHGSANQTGNIFDALDVEDIAEPVVHLELAKGSKEKQSEKKTKPQDTNDAFELGSSTEELFFTLFCFYKDLHDIQAYLNKLWADYKDGCVPLTSAAATTDLAFEVVKRKEEDMLQSEGTDSTDGSRKSMKDVFSEMQKSRTTSAVPLYWTFKKEGSLLNYGYLGELLYSYVAGSSETLGHSTDAASRDRMLRVADWLYTPAYVILDVTELASTGAEVAGQPHEWRGVLKTTSNGLAIRSARDFEWGFAEIGNLMGELAQLRAAGFDESIAMDLWTTALCELADPFKQKSKERMGIRHNRQARNFMPVWMAFATTVHLGISKLLRSEIERAFHEVRTESKKANRTITQMLQWCKRNPEPAWTKQHVEVMENVGKILKTYVEDDPVVMINSMSGFPDGPTQRPHYLMRHDPIWAGVVMLWVQLSMWDATIEMMNIYDGTLQLTHLYALALTKETFDWADMEYLLGLHDADYLFYGGRPTTLSECYRKHSLAMGMSATTVAKNRHSTRNVSARGMSHAVRQHRPNVIPSDLLSWRYKAVRMRAGPKEGPQTPLSAVDLLLEFQKRSPAHTLVRKSDSSAYLVPLLSAAQQALTSDARHLAFDYFAMHQRSWLLLGRLQAELREALTMLGRIIGQKLIGNDKATLIVMIPAIFMAVDALNGEANISLQLAPLAQLMVNAVTVVKEFAAKHGAVGLQMVQKELGSAAEEVKRVQPTWEDTRAMFDDSDSDADSKDMALLKSFMDHAPKRLVTDEQAKQAFKLAKNMPFQEMSAASREYFGRLQAEGADMSIRGILAAGAKHESRLTPAQKERVLRTTTLEEYNALLKTFDREERGTEQVSEAMDEKKKRNNKNKNKNRKLKQKEARTAGEGPSRDQALVSQSASASNSSKRANVAPADHMPQVPVVGKRHWLTSGPRNRAESEAYERARREGKMMIDGEEYIFTGRKETIFDPKDLSGGQLNELLR